MNGGNVDLNFLLVFEAIWETRSVSKASERLGLSQPSLSHALRKMRAELGDPLFVRVKNEMLPTPRAIEMADPVRQILELTRRDVLGASTFDPGSADRTFTLCMTDIGETAYLPRIVTALRAQAPRVRIKTVSPLAAKVEEGLEFGKVDLAVGYFPDVRHPGLIKQNLLRTSGFACLTRNGPPYTGGPLTLEDFRRASHISIRTEGRSAEVIEAAMVEQGISRQVFLQVPHYLSLLSIVPATDLIAVIPIDVSVAFENNPHLRIHPLPFPSPVVEVIQLWHERQQKDAAHHWLRELVRTVLRR